MSKSKSNRCVKVDIKNICRHKSSCPMYCSVCEKGECFFDKSNKKEVIL